MHLNRAKVKRTLLDLAKATRPTAGFTRVAGDVYEVLNGKLLAHMRELVRSHPSKGVTLTYGMKNKSLSEETT